MKKNRLKIKQRIKKKIYGTSERPRLSVFRSNKYIYVQIINDSIGHTLVSESSSNNFFNYCANKGQCYISYEVGKKLSEKANKIGINKIIFDRNGYPYHGRIKNLAKGLRYNGLKF